MLYKLLSLRHNGAFGSGLTLGTAFQLNFEASGSQAPVEPETLFCPSSMANAQGSQDLVTGGLLLMRLMHVIGYRVLLRLHYRVCLP